MKVEASKFTEVGYVGRDVESMIRDLTELAVAMVTEEQTRGVRCQGRGDRRGARPRRAPARLRHRSGLGRIHVGRRGEARRRIPNNETREKLRKLLRLGELDDARWRSR